MNKLLIFLLSLCVTSLQGATITNWGAQLPTAVPASGDVILMQKGGVVYYFTPVQLATFISTNLSLGTTNAIPDLNGRGTNATFAATIGVATNLWQLLGTNGLPLVLVTSNQVMIVSNTLVVSARPQSTTTVPLTIAGSQGQDANLFNVKDYLGNVLFAISYDGTFAEPRLASPSISGALWTATDDIGNGAWSTNLTPQNLSVSNVTAARALVINSSKQVTNAATTSAALDNFFAMGITSIVASTGIGIGTNGGALVITNTGATTVSNAVIANLNGKGTNTSFYGTVTGATVRATNIYDRSNVKFWGAVGDDVTDDTAAINAAITAVSAGDVVFLPSGTYKITAPILLKNGITLRGGGKLASIIKNYANTDALYATNAQSTHIVVEDLQIFDALGIGTRTAGHGINLDGTGNYAGFHIKRVYVLGHINGINAVTAAYSSIEGSRIVSTKQDGIAVSGGISVNVAFQNNGVLSCGRYGYSISNVNYATFNSDFSDSNTNHGFYVYGGSGITFNSTSSESNMGNGYHLIAAQKVVMNSVTASRIETLHGIFLDDARYVLINCPQLVTIRGWGINATNTYLDVFVLNPNISGAVSGSIKDPLGIISLYSAGKLGVGIVTPVARLHASNAVGSTGTPLLRAGTNDINGLTVTSNGIVAVGTATPANNALTVASASADYAVKILNSSAAGSSYGLLIDAGADSSDGAIYVRDKSSANPYFRVRGDGKVGIGVFDPLATLHVVGGIVQTNGGIWQTWSLGAPSAPATQGAVYWNDGTNICAVFRNAAGALSTNKLSMTAWP